MKLLALSIALLCACSSKSKDPPAAGSGTAAPEVKPDAAVAAGSDTMAKGSDTTAKGSDASGSGSAVPAGSGSGSTGGFDFSKLTQEQKIDFMKTKVMPTMKAAFQKFDPKEFKDFTCKTCHGKDPKGTKYKMPSPDIDKLDFAELKAGKHAKIAEFMGKVVKPGMAKIFERTEYTEATPDGFGCLHCHLEKK